MRIRSFVFIPVLAATLSANDSHAQSEAAATEPASGSWVGSIAGTSDYLFRGLSQTNRDPALQGSLEYDFACGFYAGAWGSNISWLEDASSDSARISSSLEIDAWAGYRGKFNDAFGYDVGVYTYYYPGDYPSGFTLPYTTELYVAISYGIASLKYSHTVTNLFGFSDSRGSGYLDLSANYEFAPSWVLNAHVGRQHVAHIDGLSYSDYKLGVTKNFARGFSAALAWSDTNAERSPYTNLDGHYLGRSTAVFTVTKSF